MSRSWRFSSNPAEGDERRHESRPKGRRGGAVRASKSDPSNSLARASSFARPARSDSRATAPGPERIRAALGSRHVPSLPHGRKRPPDPRAGMARRSASSIQGSGRGELIQPVERPPETRPRRINTRSWRIGAEHGALALHLHVGQDSFERRHPFLAVQRIRVVVVADVRDGVAPICEPGPGLAKSRSPQSQTRRRRETETRCAASTRPPDVSQAPLRAEGRPRGTESYGTRGGCLVTPILRYPASTSKVAISSLLSTIGRSKSLGMSEKYCAMCSPRKRHRSKRPR